MVSVLSKATEWKQEDDFSFEDGEMLCTFPTGQILLRFTAVSRLHSGDYLSLSLCNAEQPPVLRAQHGHRGHRGSTGCAQPAPPMAGCWDLQGRLHFCTAIPSTFAFRVLMDVRAPNSSACGRQLNLVAALATHWIVSCRFLREPKHGTVLRASCRHNFLYSRIFQGSSSGACQVWEDRRGDSD